MYEDHFWFRIDRAWYKEDIVKLYGVGNQHLDPDFFLFQFLETVAILLNTWLDTRRASHDELQWRHDERGGVSNHQPLDCLLNHLFRRRSKKTSKPRVTGPCVGISPVTGEFPAHRASNVDKVSIWRRHHGKFALSECFMIPVWGVPALFIVTNIYVLRRRYFHIKFPPQLPSPTHLSGYCHVRIVWQHSPLMTSNTHWYACLRYLVVVCVLIKCAHRWNFGYLAAYFR